MPGQLQFLSESGTPAHLGRYLLQLSARGSQEIVEALRCIRIIARRNRGSCNHIIEYLLIATNDSRVSVREAAWLAFSSFDLSPELEAQLRIIAGGGDSPTVCNAAKKVLLGHWARTRSGSIKADAQLIRERLTSKGINCLFHVTSAKNLVSMNRVGAILGRTKLKDCGVQEVTFVSQPDSWAADDNSGTSEWVHLSFHFNQPMFFNAWKSGAHRDLVILEISLDAAVLGPTVFADENATARSVQLGPEYSDLEKLYLDCFAHGCWQPDEKRSWQSEVLVHERIDACMIQGVRDFGEAVSAHRDTVSWQTKQAYTDFVRGYPV